MLEGTDSPKVQISFWEKLTRKRNVKNPQTAFDVAGIKYILGDFNGAPVLDSTKVYLIVLL